MATVMSREVAAESFRDSLKYNKVITEIYLISPQEALNKRHLYTFMLGLYTLKEMDEVHSKTLKSFTLH